MSQQALPARPFDLAPVRPAGRAERPALRVVAPPRRAAGKVPFVVLCSVLMTLGLAALLALNLSLVSGSYALHDVTAQAEHLRAQEAELTEQVALRSTPNALAEQATELGLVPGGVPAYLRLSTGEVIGRATPAPAPEGQTSADEAAATATGEAAQQGQAPPTSSGTEENGSTVTRSSSGETDSADSGTAESGTTQSGATESGTAHTGTQTGSEGTTATR